MEQCFGAAKQLAALAFLGTGQLESLEAQDHGNEARIEFVDHIAGICFSRA